MESFGTIELEGKPKMDVYINNISKGGAMLYVKENLPVNSNFRLDFEVNDRKFSLSSTIRASIF